MTWTFTDRPRVVFQVLSRQGSYPRFTFKTVTHAFSVSEDLVWSAVVQPPVPEDWEHAEVYTLAPEDSRLCTLGNQPSAKKRYDATHNKRLAPPRTAAAPENPARLFLIVGGQ